MSAVDEARKVLLDQLAWTSDVVRIDRPYHERVDALIAAVRAETAQELVAAFEAMDAACRWAAGTTVGVKTLEDAERHTAGYDALLAATVRAGVAAGRLK